LRTTWPDRGHATREIKKFFAGLGKTLEHTVTSRDHIAVGADSGEWLYDMVWYKNNEGYFSRQILVLESEIKPGNSVANATTVDVDFHKLVQARADIRVWLAPIPNTEMIFEHLHNCKKQILSFEQSQAGDFYLFILFDWSKDKSTVEAYRFDGQKF
jgi:hypothetical protein